MIVWRLTVFTLLENMPWHQSDLKIKKNTLNLSRIVSNGADVKERVDKMKQF